MQLIVNLDEDALRHADGVGDTFEVQSGTLIQGMQTRAVVLDRRDQRCVAGVVFEPGAARVLLGTSLHALAHAHVELDDLTAGEAPLRERLVGAGPEDCLDGLEAWLCDRIRGEADRTVRAALDLMRGGEQRVGVLAARVGASEQALRRRFRAEVGLSPKQMSRVLRFQRALDGLRGVGSVADVALSSGYHDQAHLAHDVRELAGVSPREYRQRQPLHRNHLG